MISIEEVKGAIFDVDDTLLDNKPGVVGRSLHEQSRLAAFREVGRRHGIKELAEITLQQNLDAFNTSPVHSMPGAVWNYFRQIGLVDSEKIDLDHELLREVVELKNELHPEILLREGDEVPGSTAFVTGLAEQALIDRLAIASSAIRRDIDLYLGKAGLGELFLADRIISLEQTIHTKPHPEAFHLAFDTLGLDESDRQNVLAFEDDPRGIAAAKSAGLIVCAITTRYSKDFLNSQVLKPDLIADTYQEFAGMFGIKMPRLKD